MRRFVIAAAACLTLAACGGSNADADGDGEISMEEAAARSADMVRPQPGKYRATVEFVDVSMPGAPQQVKDMMRSMFDKEAQSHEYCLTKEEADKGFEEMARQAQDSNSDCTFEKFDVDGGSIDAVMNCKAEGQGTARMVMTGTGTETSSEMNMTMNGEGPDGQTMTMTMKSSQQRLGDCDA